MDLIDIIKKIKITRMKPEERFILDVINTSKLQNNLDDDYLKYKINNTLVFTYNKITKMLWVDSLIIRDITSYTNNLNNSSKIITKYFRKYLYNDEVKNVRWGSPRY